MKVQLDPDNSGTAKCRDLTPGNIYRVIGIEADDFRIMNDLGMPYLYPTDLFLMIDPDEPNDWETEFGEDGERYSYPKQLGSVGFFEDYFDGDREATLTLHRYLAEKWL